MTLPTNRRRLSGDLHDGSTYITVDVARSSARNVEVPPGYFPCWPFQSDPMIDMATGPWNGFDLALGVQLVPNANEMLDRAKREILADRPSLLAPTNWQITQHLARPDTVYRMMRHCERWDFLLMVDRGHYPTPLHWWIEASLFGVWERVRYDINFGKIDGDSTLIVVHHLGMIANYADYHAATVGERIRMDSPNHVGMRVPLSFVTCPHRDPVHESWLNGNSIAAPTHCCPGLWWQNLDLRDFHTMPVADPKGPVRFTSQFIPSWNESIFGQRRPDGIEPKYRPAVIARVDGLAITVTNHPIPETHETVLQMAGRSGLPIHLAED